MYDKVIIDHLEIYQDTCMDKLIPEEMPEYNHQYSKRFYKKMKRLYWSRKYFDNEIQLGYLARKLAVIFISFLCLYTANEVSAHILGFDAWKTFQTMVDNGRGNRIKYQNMENNEELTEPKHDEPTYIPEGFQKKESEKTESSYLINWENSEAALLRYSRDSIFKGETAVYDAETENRKQIVIANINAYIINNSEEISLYWCDKQYNYRIDSYQVSEKELVKMAESIYK